MNLKFSKPTKLDWIALCIFLACVASLVLFVYNLSRAARWKSVKPYMYREISADIIDPLEKKYNLTDMERKYGVYTVELPPDDTIVLSIRLDPKDGEQAFLIARDVYELKRKSPVLSRKPLELKMWVHDPGEDGKHIHIVNPDSRYGVNLHVLMPGAPDHKPKRDLEEYLALNRKWEEIIWQKELDERRAAASAANPSNADDRNAEERGEDDSAPQQMSQ